MAVTDNAVTVAATAPKLQDGVLGLKNVETSNTEGCKVFMHYNGPTDQLAGVCAGMAILDPGASPHPPHRHPEEEFLYHGRRFQVAVRYCRGYQDSPFHDGTRANSEVTIRNLTNGKTLEYSLLVPDMIERYGFYEGRGTPYRVDPKEILAVFNFLNHVKS